MMEVEIVRCSGHCCHEFHLPQSPEQIRTNKTDDAEQIADMVIYVGPAIPEKGGHLYNCKNLSANDDCRAYATRPAMCRDFPYDGQRCPRKGCTRKVIEMEEHPTPWDLKMEGVEYVIRNANGGEVSRHKKKAEAMAAFKVGTDQSETTGPAATPPGEVVEIPPADAPVADPPPPEITPPSTTAASAEQSDATVGSAGISALVAVTTPPADKPRHRGRRK